MPAVRGTCLVSEPIGIREASASTADIWLIAWMTREDSYSSGIHASSVLRAIGALLRARDGEAGGLGPHHGRLRRQGRCSAPITGVNSPGDEYTFDCQALPRIRAACFSAVLFGFST